MVGEACLPSNAYYPRTPDYTLCSGVHVCWSEHSDSSFVYGFMILNYGFGTMTATTLYQPKLFSEATGLGYEKFLFVYFENLFQPDVSFYGNRGIYSVVNKPILALVLLLVALWFILRDDLLYVFPCVIFFLCFSVLLVLRLPRLGKRELILVLFVRLFGLCLFRFVGFLFLLWSGKGCGL